MHILLRVTDHFVAMNRWHLGEFQFPHPSIPQSNLGSQQAKGEKQNLHRYLSPTEEKQNPRSLAEHLRPTKGEPRLRSPENLILSDWRPSGVKLGIRVSLS